VITDPIVQRISSLRDIGPFTGYDDDDKDPVVDHSPLAG
jgi:hypothetical protein